MGIVFRIESVQNIILRTFIVVILAICITGCEDGDTPSDANFDFGDNDPNYVIALGDSITANGFPGILSGLSGKRVENSGMPGAIAEGGAEVVDSALSFQPGYLLILLGSNDIILGVERDATIANLTYIIKAAKANKTIPIIGTLSPMMGDYSEFAATVRQLNSKIRNAGSSNGARVADVYSAFGNNPAYISDDGLHPTAAGNGVIARTFNKRIY